MKRTLNLSNELRLFILLYFAVTILLLTFSNYLALVGWDHVRLSYRERIYMYYEGSALFMSIFYPKQVCIC